MFYIKLLQSIADCLILEYHNYFPQFAISPHFIVKKEIYLKEVKLNRNHEEIVRFNNGFTVYGFLSDKPDRTDHPC